MKAFRYSPINLSRPKSSESENKKGNSEKGLLGDLKSNVQQESPQSEVGGGVMPGVPYVSWHVFA